MVCLARLSVTATSSLYLPGVREPRVIRFASVSSSPCSRQLIRTLYQTSDRRSVSFSFSHSVFHGGVGFVGLVVDFQVIYLNEDSHLSAGVKVASSLRTNFQITENELAEADILCGDARDLIRKNQRADAQGVVLESRNGRRVSTTPTFPLFMSFTTISKLVQPGSERHCFW